VWCAMQLNGISKKLYKKIKEIKRNYKKRNDLLLNQEKEEVKPYRSYERDVGSGEVRIGKVLVIDEGLYSLLFISLINTIYTREFFKQTPTLSQAI